MTFLSNIIPYITYCIKAKTAHGIHSPFVFKLFTELMQNKNEAYYTFQELDAIRKKLLTNTSVITVSDYGAGSKIFKGNNRQIKTIARHGVSSAKFSELYFKLINFCNSKYIVELGTSIGLNTLYLSKACSEAKVFTVEGSEELFLFSKKMFQKYNATNIEPINKLFNEAFPEILKQIPQLDFLFIDGNHTYEATLNYFNMAIQKKTEQSVFVFDDINWSTGMQNAWNEIKKHPDVTLSIDLFFVGIVFFRKEQKEKQHFVLRY